MQLNEIVDLERFALGHPAFIAQCREILDRDGVLVLPEFLQPKALALVYTESAANQDRAYFCAQNHSVYLTPHNADFADDHAANRQVVSSKGCICDDDVAQDSPLRLLYNAPEFRTFVAGTTGQAELHPYADTLSSINVHYAGRGQELGWHFDNSSFAITLLIQKPDAGGRFEFIKDFRDAKAGQMNYQGVSDLLDGRIRPEVLSMNPGSLVLFRGRNSIHRVSPNEGDKTRMLAVLAYNAEEGISLSENVRMTFYGRLA